MPRVAADAVYARRTTGGSWMASGKSNRSTVEACARTAARVALVTLSALLALVLTLLGVLRLRSPGRPKPILDEDGKPVPGSISEKIHVDINGVQQGMFIKGRDARSPVLLYLHGGMPDYFLTERYPTGLEDYFTVIWWEQRGSGLSYSPDIPPQTMTVEQVVSDTLEVTNYLRTRFGRDKIYLMGHSGGTFFGIQAAARAPELYHAYIGVAQMSYQLESERLAYDYMLQRFKDDGNAKMVGKLEKAQVTMTVPLPDAYGSVRDVAMHRLGIGTTHDMRSIVSGLFLPSLLSREYTSGEKTKMWRGKLFSGRFLWNKELATDLSKQVTELEVPVYFLHGTYDYTVSYPLAKSYLEQLQAPLKGFYTFERSAHSPLFEEPEKMREIMQGDVLTRTKGLADQVVRVQCPRHGPSRSAPRRAARRDSVIDGPCMRRRPGAKGVRQRRARLGILSRAAGGRAAAPVVA
jgi:pimeloyl-ACP methyl ester carboxylesterase